MYNANPNYEMNFAILKCLQERHAQFRAFL